MIATPRDAAAVVLLKDAASAENPEIYWVRRSLQLAFLGGFHAFPGGKLEKSDAETRVENCSDKELAALVSAAAREAFEEVGVLLARGCERMTKGQLASLHDDLCSGRMTFAEILEHWELWLDAEDFEFVGTWITPSFSPVRFKTRFYLVKCPAKQTPFIASGELERGEWISAKNALEKWRRGDILCAPPIINTIRVFSEGLNENSTEKIRRHAAIDGEDPRKIEFSPRFTSFPVRTKTLPPATHTNCFIVGGKEFIVVDAASTETEEQTALHEFIDSLIERGDECKAIIVSHLHADHTGGETALQKNLLQKFSRQVPILTHKLTAENLQETTFDGFLEEGDFFELKDDENFFRLQVLHAPGHARGHLCFYDEEFGFLLSSDNVVGLGSVLIAPPEGNMRDYLASLERLKNLPNLRYLCGSHGPAIANAKEKIESYIRHRLEREQKILEAVKNGAKTMQEIVEIAYADVKPELWQLAAKSVEAHLEKLREEGRI